MSICAQFYPVAILLADLYDPAEIDEVMNGETAVAKLKENQAVDNILKLKELATTYNL